MVLLTLTQTAEIILSSKHAAIIFWERISSSYERTGSNSTLLRSTQPLLALKKGWDVREARQHKGSLSLESFLLFHPQTPRTLLLFANLHVHQKMLLWHVCCGHWQAVRLLSTRHYVWSHNADVPQREGKHMGAEDHVARTMGMLSAVARLWLACSGSDSMVVDKTWSSIPASLSRTITGNDRTNQ